MHRHGDHDLALFCVDIESVDHVQVIVTIGGESSSAMQSLAWRFLDRSNWRGVTAVHAMSLEVQSLAQWTGCLDYHQL